jgi:hypothetical protein
MTTSFARRARRLALERLEHRTLPASFTVANTNDTGAGSLRQAILDANALSGADTVQFAPTVFATPQTITLTTGELLVTDDLTIAGPGATILSVSGNNANRVVEINAAGRVLNATLSGITIKGGHITSGRGGGLYTADENVTLTNVVITGNQAGDRPIGPFSTGGGIAIGSNGNVVLRNATVSNNVCWGPGGGISCYGLDSGSLLLDSSTVSGNVGNFDGAGIYLSRNPPSGSFFVNNSTISGNTAYTNGGGLYATGPIGPGGFIVRNSTISGNTARSNGGGISVYIPVGIATVENATITKNNSSNGLGGGIAKRGVAAMSLMGSIVSGNMAGTTGSDIASAGASITASYSAIGVDPGPHQLTSPSVGNLAFGVNLNLGPLADNGGPTQTHALGSGSLAIDHGSNASGFTVDQRGQARVLGAAADIGAFESANSAPTALATVGDVTASGGTSYVFTVTYIAVAWQPRRRRIQ